MLLSAVGCWRPACARASKLSDAWIEAEAIPCVAAAVACAGVYMGVACPSGRPQPFHATIAFQEAGQQVSVDFAGPFVYQRLRTPIPLRDMKMDKGHAAIRREEDKEAPGRILLTSSSGSVTLIERVWLPLHPALDLCGLSLFGRAELGFFFLAASASRSHPPPSFSRSVPPLVFPCACLNLSVWSVVDPRSRRASTATTPCTTK